MSLALADQGFESKPDSLRINCGSRGCLAPGSEVIVRVDLRVRLPFLPGSLGETSVGSVPVSADHRVPIDTYRSAQ